MSQPITTLELSAPPISAPDFKPVATLSTEIKLLAQEALEASSLIGLVRDADDNALAVEAVRKLMAVTTAVEHARKAVKAPVLDLGRAIDQEAKRCVAPLEKEILRLNKLGGDYLALQAAKQRALEAQRIAGLSELEQQRIVQAANATSHDELDRINEEFNQSVALLPQSQPTAVQGQSLKEDWEFEVTNATELAAFHPGCVDITPRRAEVKALLKAGKQVRGVRAWRVNKAQVRAHTKAVLVEV